MLHRRLLTGTGIAFICAAAVGGCFTSGQNGDPGAGFLAGNGPYYGGGSAGAYGSGSAGARVTGGADAGTAGATGEGGSICGVAVTTADAGASMDGAIEASAHDGAAASEAGVTEAGASEAGATEAGATEAGPTTAAAPACTVGAISLTWSLEQAGTTIGETCAQAGVATIRLVANTMNVDFKCTDGAGRTPALTAGTYAVSLHALDATGAALSDTSTMNVAVSAGQITSLGNAVFDVD